MIYRVKIMALNYKRHKKQEESNMKRFALISLMILSLGLMFALTCYDIQYTETPGADNTFPSAYVGQTVTVTGIVTNNTYGTTSTYPTSTKFYISDPTGGPWSGLYIYVFGTGVQVGDLVTVTGPLSEYYGTTEVVFQSGVTTTQIISSGNQLPAPVLVPTSLMPYNSSTTNPPPTAAAAEPFESVLCKVENVTATSTPDTHDEFYVTDGSGAGQIDNACYLYGHHWAGITVGQHWDRIVGIFDYSYYMFGINPRTDADMVTTANEDNYQMLPDAQLIGNFPNPFAGETVIALNLKSVQPVQVSVYNLKGQLVRNLVNGNLAAQLHNITFDGKDNSGNLLPSGIYMYKMTAGSTVQTRKLVIR
jgi:hypothetical protein